MVFVCLGVTDASVSGQPRGIDILCDQIRHGVTNAIVTLASLGVTFLVVTDVGISTLASNGRKYDQIGIASCRAGVTRYAPG